jgi:hypothetical protein
MVYNVTHDVWYVVPQCHLSASVPPKPECREPGRAIQRIRQGQSLHAEFHIDQVQPTGVERSTLLSAFKTIEILTGTLLSLLDHWHFAEIRLMFCT